MISGYVQGVGYRYWTRLFASRMGLRGWVRNLEDGRVELLAIGPTADLDSLVDACRLGPGSADVHEVVVTDIEAPDGIQGFEIRP